MTPHQRTAVPLIVSLLAALLAYAPATGTWRTRADSLHHAAGVFYGKGDYRGSADLYSAAVSELESLLE